MCCMNFGTCVGLSVQFGEVCKYIVVGATICSLGNSMFSIIGNIFRRLAYLGIGTLLIFITSISSRLEIHNNRVAFIKGCSSRDVWEHPLVEIPCFDPRHMIGKFSFPLVSREGTLAFRHNVFLIDIMGP
jgi:hypothetical protein